MIDAKLLNQKVESTEPAPSIQSPGNPPQNADGKTQFNEIFDEKIQELNNAKSGIHLPVNIDQQLLIESESDGAIDSESTEIEKKEHTLGSRSKLIVMGDEPSEDSLIEFAKSQGINIAFLERSAGDEQTRVNFAKSQGINIAFLERPAGDEQTRVNSELTKTINLRDIPELKVKIESKKNSKASPLDKLSFENKKLELKPIDLSITKTELFKMAKYIENARENTFLKTSNQINANDKFEINSQSVNPNKGLKNNSIFLSDPALAVSNKQESQARPSSLVSHSLHSTVGEAYHERYHELSRRLAQALGNRLSTQIEKGAWRVEMDLHPRSLGRIEIQLEMRNGELEAYFNSNQNLTRDLLSESFSKLRDSLLQHGIDSAYIGLGKENNRETDENLTETSSDQTEKAKSQEDMHDEVSVDKVENDTGRLDIKV